MYDFDLLCSCMKDSRTHVFTGNISYCIVRQNTCQICGRAWSERAHDNTTRSYAAGYHCSRSFLCSKNIFSSCPRMCSCVVLWAGIFFLSDTTDSYPAEMCYKVQRKSLIDVDITRRCYLFRSRYATFNFTSFIVGWWRLNEDNFSGVACIIVPMTTMLLGYRTFCLWETYFLAAPSNTLSMFLIR